MSTGDIPLDLLRQLFAYDPLTGKFVWKTRPPSHFPTRRGFSIFHARYAGKEAFTAIGKNGYRTTRHLGKNLSAHRVAWALMTGEWPSLQIDHINGDRTCNIFANLREASQSTQNRNSALPRNNTSGRIGVKWDRTRKKWVAQTNLAGKSYFLGRYDSFELACAARARMEAANGFHPNHGRKQTTSL